MPSESKYVDTFWYRTFFRGLANDMWRQAVPPELTRKQAEFIAQQGAPPAGLVLDVPCGNGRIALELAKRGFQVTGVDLSEESIHEAQSSAIQQGSAVEFQCREMRDLPWKDRFDLAVCWGNSFGYLDDAGDREVLQSISRALKPGGRLMLETGSIAETLWPQFQAQKSYQFGDIHFHAVRRYDFRQSRLHIEYQFRRGEENVAQSACQRVYTVRELCELLEAAELRIDSLWGGIDGSPLALGSPQLIVLAVREG